MLDGHCLGLKHISYAVHKIKAALSSTGPFFWDYFPGSTKLL